ncbi:ABC transporter permease [Phytoactinopolyspora alkaliphila]|uniref:ABC transporter permease n=1 Tax=Phytoactinopolyspora alkaliphila TaxID=1783498 RepID=A0A6N9YLY5_9ACTN|nr:ABC transporter permease [Phytoactinopolyspora alkaliphila]NED96046.1 ABC transporter permease [Phytoactinopolyspora alkaliphila]
MTRLALRTLRFRAGTFVAAFLAMFFAAAMVMACGGLMETGIRTAVPPQQLDSADIVVAGDQKYDVPGAEEAAILPERVRVDAGLEDTISALPGVQDTDSHVLEGQPPAGTVDAIGIRAQPGTDVSELRERIDAELDGGAITLIGDERGLAELRDARTTSVGVISLSGVFGGFAIMVSMFGVASMLALSVNQRQRDMALLRAVGATPRQLRRLILGETLVLSLFATALAYVPGQYLGEFVFDRMADNGVATAGVAFHQGWIPTVSAMAAAILAAVLGALGAGRRAARIKPTQALAEASLEGKLIGGWRVFFGLLFLAGGIALTTVTATVMSGPLTSATAGPAVIVFAIGFALLSPVLTKIMTVLLQWPVRALGGLTGHLAVLNARGRTSTTAAVVAPVILLTGVAAGTLYLQTTNDAAERQIFANSLVIDAVVTAEGQVDAELVEQIRELPGVAGASEHLRSTGFIENPVDRSPWDQGWHLLGVNAEGADATTPVEVTEGALTDLHGDTIALEDGHAAKLGVGVGDTITLRLGDNATLDVHIAALFSASDEYDTLLLPADTLAPHTTEGFVTQILVKAEADAGPEQLVADLNELTAGQDGLAVADRDALFGQYEDGQETAAFANYILVLMIVGYAAISVINTLVSSTMARRREFGLQRLAGSTRGQVMRMVGTEGTFVAVTGVALGTIASLAILVPVSLKRVDSVVPAGSPLIYAAIAGLAVLLTLGAMLLPAWRATRGRPAKSAVAIE